MKKILSLVAIITIFLTAAACSKKEEQPKPAAPQAPMMQPGPIMQPGPMTQPQMPGLPPGHETMGQKVEYNVVVPPEVKGKWSAVKLIIEDKQKNKTQEYTIKLGSEFKVPDSALTIKVGDFLPDFKLGAQVITSASNNPVNPAVGVIISEGGAQIFPESGKWGWLYAKHPTIHPFQHNRFSIILKEGMPG